MSRRQRDKKTKTDLVDRVYRRHGALTKKEAAEAVDSVFSAMKATLVDGEPIRITNFGVFEVVSRAGREGVDPRDGSALYIPPHRGLSFRPSERLKHRVDSGSDEGSERDD